MSIYIPDFYESIVEACERGELWGVEPPSNTPTQLEIDFNLNNAQPINCYLFSGFACPRWYMGIDSGFDDDDNDGDGMTFPELQGLKNQLRK